VSVYAPLKGEPWCGILSFTIDDVKPQVVESALGAKGVAVRAGLHCASWTHRWLGTMEIGGAIRISLGHINSAKDTKIAAELLKKI
jgi:selenocysteine lyase/cysteine desulfurase